MTYTSPRKRRHIAYKSAAQRRYEAQARKGWLVTILCGAIMAALIISAIMAGY